MVITLVTNNRVQTAYLYTLQPDVEELQGTVDEWVDSQVQKAGFVQFFLFTNVNMGSPSC